MQRFRSSTYGYGFSLIMILMMTFHHEWANADEGGCSADPVIPERPFVVVWNKPTKHCEDHGIHLDFQSWGIVDNDRDRFFGQKIVLLYTLGKWPYYKKQGVPVNGGLPQLADLDAHLAKVDDDLKTSVWNNSFNGLSIIDQEHWRPLYWLNFDSLDIYQKKSLALAKQRFPQYNKTALLNEARKEFDTAARIMMGETLARVTAKRPGGKWGFYLYPRYWNKGTTISNNDRMSWVFENSTGLYPSIYFKLKESIALRELKIKNTLQEAFRVKAKYSKQDVPILPYSKSQDGPYQMFQKSDLSYAILQPANMGSSGVVLWGSSHDAQAQNECVLLKNYIKDVLGPYCLNVTNFFGNCSQQLCNGHGRCVRKDYERTYQHHLRESNRSECLIPEEHLSSTTVENQEINQKEERSSLPYEQMKNDIFRGKRSESSGVFRMTSDIEENESKGDLGLNFETFRTYKKLKGSKEYPRESYGMEKDLPKTQKMEELNHETSGIIPESGSSMPEYDFDDYVCKCYPGASGIHCEN